MPYSKEEQARYGRNISRANKRNRYQRFTEIAVGDVVLNTTGRLFKGRVLIRDDDLKEITIIRDHDDARFTTRLWRGLVVRERFDSDLRIPRGTNGGRPKGSKNRRNIYE